MIKILCTVTNDSAAMCKVHCTVMITRRHFLMIFSFVSVVPIISLLPIIVFFNDEYS